MYKKNIKNNDVPKWHIAKIWLMIRLTTVILIATFMQVSAGSFAQKITLSRSNAPLKSVLKELKNQSGYVFLFTETQLKIAKPVNLKVNGQDFQEVLKSIFENQPLTYTINEKTITIKEKEKSIIDRVIDYFLNIDVKGKVVDENGQPLVGASVLIKGTNRLIITNEVGEFSFTGVDEKAVLVIYFIGYQPKELGVKKELGDVKLVLSSAELDEVVINTGYQRTSVEKLTGSYQHISAKVLEEQVGFDLLPRLEAVANGVSIDRESNDRGRINIRGVSTINGAKQVLVVLDNFPYEGDMDNINPNDVESISILKDAAATSIWGSRAGNGVIVITTKKGKYNQGLRISASVNTTIKERPNLSRLPQMNSSDYIDAELFLFNAGRYLADYNNVARPAVTPVVDLMYSNLTADQKTAQLAIWRKQDVRDDFNRYMYRNGATSQYFMQATAGGKSYGWSLSAGHDRVVSTLSATNGRTSLRYALNADLAKSLKLNFGLAVSDSYGESGKLGYGRVTSVGGVLYPYASFADAEGNALAIPKSYRLSYLATLDSRLLDWKYYPLKNDAHEVAKSKRNDMDVNVGLNYSSAGFTASLLGRFEKQWGSNRQLYDLESFFARNLINSLSQLSSTGMLYKVPFGAIDDRSATRLQATDFRGQLGYDKKLKQHSFRIMAGAERRELLNQSERFRNYGYDENLMNTTQVDYITPYPNFITGAGGFIPYVQSLGATNNRYVSLYGNMGYDYADKYLLYASARRDATNFFGVNTNNKWRPLWSVGAGWIISKESFYQLAAVEYLKLRISYGHSGNANPTQTGVTTIRYGTISPYTLSPDANIDKIANPELRWEKVTTTNIGLDFKLLAGRLSGSIDYYQKRGTDLFGVYPIDYTTGVGTTILRNVASMLGKGADLQLNSVNVDNGFKWETQLNLSANRDKVTDYYFAPSNAYAYATGTQANISGVVGRPVYSLFSFASAGLNSSGNPVGFLNGEKSTDYVNITQNGTSLNELTFHGAALPTWFGNLQQRFNYKGFGLQLSLSFKAGYYFRRSSINYNNFISSGQGHRDFSERWQQPGDEAVTSVPSFIYPNNTSRDVFYASQSSLVERADHVRLQYINLSYSLPSASFKGYFKAASLYCNVANLGIVWRANKKGLDPELNGLTNFPAERTLSLGCRLNF